MAEEFGRVGADGLGGVEVDIAVAQVAEGQGPGAGQVGLNRRRGLDHEVGDPGQGAARRRA